MSHQLTELWHRIYRAEQVQVSMALDTVKTEAGARAIHTAETTGRNRPVVLRMAERRIEQLRGREAPGRSTVLIAKGQAIEGRIVAAVGSGVRHGRANADYLVNAMADAVSEAQSKKVCDPEELRQCQVDARYRALRSL